MKNEKINIADVLRNRMNGVSLYSPLCGYVRIAKITDRNFIYCKPLKAEIGIAYVFTQDGRYCPACLTVGTPECGECMLFPSYIYRNWNIFLFEKGDFVSLDFHYRSGNVLTYAVLFDCIDNKMNVKTFVAYNVNEKEFLANWSCTFDPVAFGERKLIVRQSSDEEIRILMDEMQKAGYEWHANKKDFTKKPQTTVCIEAKRQKSASWNFKPFDKVLVRDSENGKWRPDFFSAYDENEPYKFRYEVIGNCISRQCIPYNEKTAHLLGTSNPYKDND